MESLKFEYRAVTKFLLKERCKATASHQCLVAMYGDSATDYCTVTRWFNEFTRGHQYPEDESGQPSDAVNPMSITTAEKQIMTNRKLVSEIAKELQVLVGCIENIVHEHLHMSKVSTRWVPRNLNVHIDINSWPHAKSFWICIQVIKKRSVVVW